MLWNIRKIVKKGDYLYAVVPEHPRAIRYGYVLAHIVVLENKLGRMLVAGEESHHIDENKKNNNPDNLEPRFKGEHQSYHMQKRYPNGEAIIRLVCANCGVEFDRHARQRPQVKKYKNAFCTRHCAGTYNGYQRAN